MARTDSELLEEMTRWLKIIGIQEIKPVLHDVFDYEDDEKEASAKIAYELTDGENSTRDIAEHIDFSYKWVQNRQREWAAHGLVGKEESHTPYSKIISLIEIGIDVPGLDDVLDEIAEGNGGDNDE